MSRAGFGHRLCVGWVFWYTRHIPWTAAEERRDELMSDLWEHEAEAARTGDGHVAHQLAIIRRMLAGMPADLAWRRGARSSQQAQVVALATAGRSSQPEVTRSKRWVCRMIGHRERRFPYPGSGDSGGYYLLCGRCGRVHADDKTQDQEAMVKMGTWGL